MAKHPGSRLRDSRFPKSKGPDSRLPDSLSIALWLAGSLWVVGIAAHALDAPREIVYAAFGIGIIAGAVEWIVLRRARG